MSETKKRRTRKPKDVEATFPPVEESGGTIVCDQEVTTCPKCGSEKRQGYHGNKTVTGPVMVHGVMYERIELKRTRCLECGQCRIDRFKIPLA